MKKKLHIHSDCYKWGGSENMVGVFLQNEKLNDLFDISFSYRYTPEYKEGLCKWVPNTKAKLLPLTMPITWFYKIKKYFPPVMALGYFLSCVDAGDMLRDFNNDTPDILHIINGGYPGAYSCNSMAVAGRLAKIPKITYFLTSTTSNPLWYKPMTIMVRNSVDTFISASKHLRTQSTFLRNRKHNDWANISNTIQDVPIDSISMVREQMGIPQDEIVFLCMGDLVKRKGFDRAIDAFSQMGEVGSPRSLLIVGNGPEDENLRNQMKNKTAGIYRIFNKIDIHLYSIINAADVLIVPSLGEEDWPNVILIAMKYGKPCVVSNVCGLPEMIIDAHDGYVFYNHQDLIGIMDRLLTDQRIIMGNRAKLHYVADYRENTIVDEYIKLWKGNIFI